MHRSSFYQHYADKETLLADAGIVRNRAKILATIGNAQATVALRALTEQADEIRLVEHVAVGDRDRYGRLLRQVLVDDVDVGEEILAAGHARRYAALSTASPVAARYRHHPVAAR